MANYRSILSGEHRAKLWVHPELLPAYEAALTKSQYGVEFSIENGTIALFSEQESDVAADIKSALEVALTYGTEAALLVSEKLRTRLLGMSEEEFFEQIIQFEGFAEAEEYPYAFILLVICGLGEPLLLEQVGHEKCAYVTYQVEQLLPIQQYIDQVNGVAQEAPKLEGALKYPINQHPYLLRQDWAILFAIWRKYSITGSPEFMEEVLRHLTSLTFNVGWFLNHIGSEGIEGMERAVAEWDVRLVALEWVAGAIEQEAEIEKHITWVLEENHYPVLVDLLWAEFNRVSVNNQGQLEKPFIRWKAGTTREDVYEWFGSRHPFGLEHLLRRN